MMDAKNRAAEKIKRNLFLPTAEVKDTFSQMELERKKRIMLCVTAKLDDPIISDRELVTFLTTGCEGLTEAVSSSTAYRDLRIVNDLSGNIRLASKDWERYMVVETAKEEVKKWKGKDGKAVAALLKVIALTRQLDKDDKENILENMIPPEWLITNDATTLGENIEVIKDADKRIAELRTLFRKRKNSDITDADYEETT